MYQIRLLGILFLMAIFEFVACDKIDSNKNQTENRIISLAPHITEIIFSLDANRQLVGVSDFCNFPAEAKQIEKIGGLFNPNIEKMIILNPTHIFGLPSHEKLDQELKKFGLSVTMIPNENIADVLFTIKKIGNDLGRSETASELILEINNNLITVRRQTEDKFKLNGVLIIGRNEGTLQNIMVAGADTYLNEIWSLIGGRNCYDDLPIRYGTINLESLLIRNPDLIIEFDLKRERGVYRSDDMDQWQSLRKVNAIRNENVFVIGGDHTLIPGPRMIYLVEDFIKVLQLVTENRSQAEYMH